MAPPVEPAVSTDDQRPCSYMPVVDYAGHTNSSPSASRSGAQALIDLSNANFDLCIPSGYDRGNANAYIAVLPRTTADPKDIIRFGIVECRWEIAGTDVCDGENGPVLFVSWGGCIPWNDDPERVQTSSYYPHRLSLYLDYDNYWKFVYDGKLVKTIPNSWVECWAGTKAQGHITIGPLMATYAFRTLDRGDQLGQQPSDRSWMFDVRYGRYGSGWYNPGWSGGPCLRADGYHNCSLIGTSGGDDLMVDTQH